MGIERRLKGMDGSTAAELWEHYIKNNDENALSTLLEYNKEDVMMLKTLKEKLAESLGTRLHESERKKSPTPQARKGKYPLFLELRLPTQSLSGKIFVITGRLESFSRPEAEAIIKQLGGIAKDNVTRKTDYVVVGAEPGSKAEKAARLGIPKLSEAEFLVMIGRQQP